MRNRYATRLSTSLATPALLALTLGACAPAPVTAQDMNAPDQSAPAPTITSITPSRVPTTGGAVTVKGSNLRAGLGATIDGLAVTATLVSADEARLTAPARPGRIGPVEVTLRNADGATARDARSLSYYLGTVTFAPGASVSVDSGRIGALVDLDRDGKSDFLIAGNQLVYAFKGDGQGGFGAAVTYATGCQSNDLLYADFTGDKIGDVLVNCFDGQTLLVLPGKADGTFAAPLPAITTTSRPQRMAIGDFNKDGKADVVVSHGSINQGALYVLLGKGDGSFQAPLKLPITDQATVPEYNQPCAGVADFNKDGNLDTYVCLYQLAKIGYFLGKGDGTFGALQTLAVRGIGAAAGDVDGDGAADLLTTDNVANTVSLFLGKGDGTFRDPQVLTGFKDPREIYLRDFNQDGAPDLVVSNYQDSVVSVLLNGGGAFPAPALALPAPLNSLSLTLGDANNDGLPDIVAAPTKGNAAFLLNSSR